MLVTVTSKNTDFFDKKQLTKILIECHQQWHLVQDNAEIHTTYIIYRKGDISRTGNKNIKLTQYMTQYQVPQMKMDHLHQVLISFCMFL